MKKTMVFLIALVLIACALFWRQVWGIFAGMSVIESMSMIVQFVLHATVATIIGYVAMTLPEYIKPWLKTFRWKQRQARRVSRRPVQSIEPVMNSRKLTVDQILRLLAPASTTIKKMPHAQEPDERVDLKF